MGFERVRRGSVRMDHKPEIILESVLPCGYASWLADLREEIAQRYMVASNWSDHTICRSASLIDFATQD